MKYLILVLLLSGCATNPASKDCLVQAIGFSEAFRSSEVIKQRWDRVLIMYWDGKKAGHAVHVFDSERGIYAKDKNRSSVHLTRDRSLRFYPRALAELYAPNSYVREAYFFEP